MRKFKLSEIKAIARDKYTVDITNASSRDAIQERYEQVGYSTGVYGLNGALFQGKETGTMYAITARSTALFIFC